MQLSELKIKQFQELYKNRFNVELSTKDALEKASQLIRLLEIIYKPITQQQLAKLQLYDAERKRHNAGTLQ